METSIRNGGDVDSGRDGLNVCLTIASKMCSI